MKLHFASVAWVAALGLSACTNPPAPPHARTTRTITQDERMAWWREARFGMFIHWGLYSIPAGEWNGETGHAEWIRETAHIPVETYEKFQAQFNPTKFDAEQWATLAADAGMRYLVITSKHHDGFNLFDSKESDWDVMNTPFHRDVLKELSEACARHKIRFCTYHSIMDWHHPDYLPRRSWENRPVDGADFERFVKYLHAEVSEVITRYHPSVMWFDGEWENTWTHERGVALFDLCRSLDPKLIVNNRVDVHRAGMGGFNQSSEAVGDFSTPEQEIPATGMPGVDWETCMTMNDHWGYNSHDKKFKSADELIRNLVDIASKGGNFLLNIGPTSEGVFPQESLERLRAIGAWMKVNGSSIHDTTASVFDSLPFGRCTVRVGDKRSKLFLHVFDWPKSGELTLPGLGNKTHRAYLLSAPDLELEVKSSGGQLHIELPHEAPDRVDTVVVLDIEGKPLVYKAPVIRAPADEFVNALEIEMLDAPKELELRYTLDDSEPTRLSKRYSAPFAISDSTIVKARVFDGNKAVSSITTRTFSKVTPHAAAAAAGKSAGLAVSRFDGDWNQLPDPSSSKPSSEFVAANVTLGDLHDEHVALRFGGFINVPSDDLYVFALDSDDGSKLWIDGQIVVDNDGLHGAEEKRGSVPLAKGPHAIEVGWFNKTGGAALSLHFAEVGASLRAVPDASFSH